MYFKQTEILKGLDERFTARMMEVGVESSYEPGSVLFCQGDAALNFYILVEGRVKLSTDDYSKSIFTVNHTGEAFGWSSLVGGHAYTATAICVAPSMLTVFHRDHMENILSGDPGSAALFYRNLALTLGNRLTSINSQLADDLSVNEKITYGTGQILRQAKLT